MQYAIKANKIHSIHGFKTYAGLWLLHQLAARCSLLTYRLWVANKAQPSSSERLAAAFTARMKAPLTPDVSSSARPVMVVPPGLVTLSFSSAGWVTRPSSFASKI